MSKRYMLGSLVVIILIVGGFAVAQQSGKPTVVPEKEIPGRFAVALSANGTVLVDTATGESWVLRTGLDGPHGLPATWRPIRRLDTQEKVEEWERLQQILKQDREKMKAAK
jgi:hypothetical protein